MGIELSCNQDCRSSSSSGRVWSATASEALAPLSRFRNAPYATVVCRVPHPIVPGATPPARVHVVPWLGRSWLVPGGLPQSNGSPPPTSHAHPMSEHDPRDIRTSVGMTLLRRRRLSQCDTLTGEETRILEPWSVAWKPIRKVRSATSANVKRRTSATSANAWRNACKPTSDARRNACKPTSDATRGGTRASRPPTQGGTRAA